MLRVASRLNPDMVAGRGSPTNELMRHMLFVLLLTHMFAVDRTLYLVPMFMVHAVTMLVPFKLTILIRGLATTATAVTLVNVALVAAWLIPAVTPLVATAFIATYLYSLIIGGTHWLSGRENRTV